jgi:hypothetical protein
MRLLILTIASVMMTVLIVSFSSEKSNETFSAVSIDTVVASPLEHRRPPDQTFLTFPEWYLVFSPEEFASFTKDNSPDEFPFFGHIGQLWQGYDAVYGTIKDRYPFNTGYHVMIMVIGGSTTVEYSLRACYEKTVGRVTSLITSSTGTEEDRYAAKVARDYVDFIKVLPWYEFDFKSRLIGLWHETPATGENFLRKWERRYILTTDYAAKALYGWLIKKATKASYDEALLVTSLVVSHEPSKIDSSVEVVSRYSDGSMLLLVPRYDDFKNYVQNYAREGIDFSEIAGNRDVVMVTFLVPAHYEFSNATKLFTQSILTNPSMKREALVVSIKDLGNLLRTNDSQDIVLEHVYDF